MVDILRKIHAALLPGGLLIDPQPISAHPLVTVGERELGTADMREWAELIEAVDTEITRSADDGLWTRCGERHYIVTDSFETGAELVETVDAWVGARVPAALARKLAREGPAQLHQQVRMRLLEAV